MNIASTVVNDVLCGSGTFRDWVTRKTSPVTAKPARPLITPTRRPATSSSSNVGSRRTVHAGPAMRMARATAIVATTTYPITAAMSGMYAPDEDLRGPSTSDARAEWGGEIARRTNLDPLQL